MILSIKYTEIVTTIFYVIYLGSFINLCTVRTKYSVKIENSSIVAMTVSYCENCCTNF